MNNGKIFYWSITVALAGFLFGFDTVVISGAEQTLQELWGTSELFHGIFVMGSALIGTVIGALFGNYPTDILGRKKTLIWIGMLYFISAIGSSLAPDPITFTIFRFLGGLGVGASTITAPAYVSEIAPANNRGKLVALYQFNIVFGILMAYISNFLLRDVGAEPWRWMVGAEAIPAFIYTLMVLGVPESPRWLLNYKDDEQGARRILKQIYDDTTINNLINLIKAKDNGKSRNENIYQLKYRRILILAFLVAFFNQFSGINAFLYYAPRIFEQAGLGASTALLSSIGIGVTNLVFTLLGLYLIDKMGRKTLMYIGSFGYIFSLTMVAISFFLGWGGLAVPGFLFIFIAAHAIGQGTVIWVFISEIFPNHLRAKGQTFGSSTHWVLAALIPSLIPFTLSKVPNPGVVFIFFAFMMVLQLLFVWKMMPETKGIPLEELQEHLLKA